MAFLLFYPGCFNRSGLASFFTGDSPVTKMAGTSRRCGGGKRMRKKYFYPLMVLIFFFLLQVAGCWEGREINQRAFVFAVAFDLPDDEEEAKRGEFTLGLQFPNPSRRPAGEDKGVGVDPKKPLIVSGTPATTVLSG